MSTLTLQVIHTLDPVSIEALRNLFIPAVPVTSTPVLQAPAPVQQTSTPPVQPAAPTQITAPITPPPAPAQTVAPAAPPPATAPTSDRVYSIDELARAGAALMDAGKGAEAVAAMQQFGIQRITDLAPEQYAAFAAILRGLGAKI